MAIPTSNDRRVFVRSLSYLTATIIGWPLISKASGSYVSIWSEIVDYARWCPSVHNMQPHKVKVVSANEAVLFCDTTRLLPVEDPDCRFCTAAMGIFIEHLSIAAASHSLTIAYELLNDIMIGDKGLVAFANLKLVPTSTKEVLNRELIKQRRTSRLHYDGSLVNYHVIDYMKNVAADFNQDFYSTTDKGLVDFIIDQNQRTLFEDIDSDAGRNELDSIFRYDTDEAKTRKDGLWSVCMNFPGGLMRSVFQHYQKWDYGLKKDLIRRFYVSSFKGTTNLGWFAGGFNNTPEWVNGGRMLARNWLFLTSQGLYIQPFGSLITNKNAYKKMSEKLNLLGEKKLWMIFRIGYSKEPARSYRLDLKDILI